MLSDSWSSSSPAPVLMILDLFLKQVKVLLGKPWNASGQSVRSSAKDDLYRHVLRMRAPWTS